LSGQFGPEWLVTTNHSGPNKPLNGQTTSVQVSSPIARRMPSRTTIA
jgi:hypothetical protein